MKLVVVGALALFCVPIFAHPESALEAAKRFELRFMSEPHDGAIMSEPVPKYSAKTNQVVRPNRFLRSKEKVGDHPLLRSAQMKASADFQQAECKQFFRKKMPGLGCPRVYPEDATIEVNDKLEDLTDTWIRTRELVKDLSRIPAKGETSLPIWSDDYWRTRRGGTSYRYQTVKDWEKYQEAVDSYQQPKAWQEALKSEPRAKVEKELVAWSPAEKYDLTVGDPDFGLTSEQKGEGADDVDKDGKVEDWVGICDGWSAAAVMTPKPKRAVKATAANGYAVTWYPADIRAMASLAWAKASPKVNFISGRCDAKKPETFANGRLKQRECFDTNPATFHLALGNMIGVQKKSFIMDSTFDYEVWNQPLAAYEFTYFNPLDPNKTSKDWKQVAVNYDKKFKEKDRFQDPLTRGSRKGEKYNDRQIGKVVGVIATVAYFSEWDPPEHTAVAAEDDLDVATYTYDLELQRVGNRWEPKGGEWHQNAHPDFLWVPRAGSVAHADLDDEALEFDPTRKPNHKVTKTAQKSSEDAYPLCQVIAPLINLSSGGTYRCGGN